MKLFVFMLSGNFIKGQNATIENRHKNMPTDDDVQHLRDHVLEGLHDLGALCFLKVGETAGDDDNC